MLCAPPPPRGKLVALMLILVGIKKDEVCYSGTVNKFVVHLFNLVVAKIFAFTNKGDCEEPKI